MRNLHNPRWRDAKSEVECASASLFYCFSQFRLLGSGHELNIGVSLPPCVCRFVSVCVCVNMNEKLNTSSRGVCKKSHILMQQDCGSSTCASGWRCNTAATALSANAAALVLLSLTNTQLSRFRCALLGNKDRCAPENLHLPFSRSLTQIFCNNLAKSAHLFK